VIGSVGSVDISIAAPPTTCRCRAVTGTPSSRLDLLGNTSKIEALPRKRATAYSTRNNQLAARIGPAEHVRAPVGWTKTFTDPRLCAAIVDRLTYNATLIETGTQSYRLSHSRNRQSGKEQQKPRKVPPGRDAENPGGPRSE
jgi:hypothetical protein